MARCAGFNLEINAGVGHHGLLYFKEKGLVVLAVKVDDWVVLVRCVGNRRQLRDGWLRPQLGDPMVLILLRKIAVETTVGFFHVA